MHRMTMTQTEGFGEKVSPLSFAQCQVGPSLARDYQGQRYCLISPIVTLITYTLARATVPSNSTGVLKG